MQSLLISLIFVISLFSALNLIPTFFYFQDINNNFGLHYFVFHIFSIIILFCYRNTDPKLKVRASLILTIIMLCYYSPTIIELDSQPRRACSGTSKTLSILLSNIHGHYANPSEVESLIRTTNPDLVVLLEQTHKTDSFLNSTLNNYYRLSMPRVDNFGIALYSKYDFSTPVTSLEGTPLNPQDKKACSPPVIVTSIRFPQQAEVKSITLAALHATPPISQGNYYTNKLLLRRLAGLFLEDPENLIVVGDLNGTPFSKSYQKLTSWLDLTDARVGKVLNSSWPNSFPYIGLMLDHILVSKNFNVKHFKVYPTSYSDHKAIYAELAFCH